MKANYGCIGIVVDAKTESVGFYKKLGFVSLAIITGELASKPQPEALFLAIQSIEKALNN
jgi:hypothetical protein